MYTAEDKERRERRLVDSNGVLPPSIPSEVDVRIQVDSGLLKRISPAFKYKFRNVFAPDYSFDLHGPIGVAFPDDDPTAMLVLMKIVHGSQDDVPVVDSTLLAEVIILSAKYQVPMIQFKKQFHKWGKEIPKLEEANTAGTLLWVCLSWWFGDRVMFKDATKRLILESRGRERTDLPIPGGIMG